VGRIRVSAGRAQRSSPRSPTFERLFTVFTPTYNRGHTLGRAYESLAAQTLRDFEWLVVDNASTDNTAELMAGWQQVAAFPIRYLRNATNIGRQGSWARAIAEARGELFTELRSADGLVPTALERLAYHWQAIPEGSRHEFSAVSALVVDENGRLIGTQFPSDILDSDSIEIRDRYRVRGDKWGFQRTQVLREVEIAQIPGYVGYFAEAIVWRTIARRYRTRYVNERLRIFWQDQPPGLSRPVVGWINAPGRVLEAEDRLNHDLKWLPKVPLSFYREAVAYVCSSLHAGRSFRDQMRALRPRVARGLWLAALPPGVVAFLIQRFLPAVAIRLPNP
jgi:glycosyltransferase involved in cell wall biosynthesis